VDEAKCRALKAELIAQPEPIVVPISRFFDGNDDLGSIGCNLDPHPGINIFQKVLTGLIGRTDIQAVYAQISESDPGEGCWPFTDTILVVGNISANLLREEVSDLEPSEVGAAEEVSLSPTIAERFGSPVAAIWWD